MFPLAFAGLCALAAVAYSTSFGSGFVFDNQAIVLDDPRLRALTLANLHDILTRSYWWPTADSLLYRPFTTLTYLLNYAVLGNGTHPAGYHAVNLAIHMANTCLVAAIARRISGRPMLAVGIAAVWSVHPILTEAVTNIVGRADLLAALGILGALYSHLRIRERHDGIAPLWCVALGLSAAVAAFSKESGVVVVGVIVLYDLILGGRPLLQLTQLLPWIVTAVPVGLFLLQRAGIASVAGEASFPFVDNPIAGAGVLEGRLTALAVAGRYLGLLLWPQRLSPDYSFPQIPIATGTPGEWLAWLAVLVAFALAVWTWRWSRALFFVCASGALAFLPVSNLLFATGTIMAERLMYLPAVSVAAACVVGVEVLLARANRARLLPVLIGILVVAGTARTVVRNGDWTNELTLWEQAVRVVPNSFKAHSAYAEALYAADAGHTRLDAAIDAKERSLALLEGVPNPASAIKPYYQAAAYHLERGDRTLEREKDVAKARTDFTRARTLIERYLALLPDARRLPNPPASKDESDAYLMLSSLTLRVNDGRDAVAAATASRTRQPFAAVGYQGEAAALLAANRPEDAVVSLLTGFVVTGTAELREAAIQIYRAGLDREGCATRTSAAGAVALNPECSVVHRNLCAATEAAIAIYEGANRRDLAEQTRTAVLPQFNCASR